MNITVNATGNATATNSTHWLASWGAVPLSQIPTADLFGIGALIVIVCVIIGTGIAVIKYGWDKESVLDSLRIGVIDAAITGMMLAAFVRLLM
jgi:hypothetical protein